MKKIFLTSFLALSAIAASAQETYTYTPAVGVATTAYQFTKVGSGDNAVDVKVGDEVVQMIRVPASEVSRLGGNQISAVSFYSGLSFDIANSAAGYSAPAYRTVDIVLSNGLTETPFYTETVSLPDGYLTQKTVQLASTPAVDASKPLYVGVRMKIVSPFDYYLPSDQSKTAAVGSNYSYVVGDTDANSADWDRAATQGNACIGVTFSGNSLPQNGVTFVSHESPYVADLNQPFTVPVTVRGTAANKAATMTVEYTINGETKTWTGNILDPVTRQPRPIGQNEEGVIEVSGIVSNRESTATWLTIKGSKVNGNDNLTTSTSYATMEFPTFVVNDGYERILVMEEATSLSCGYCPAGAALMTYLGEKYPDSFIMAAYHLNYGGASDPMTVESCQPWITRYATAYPFGLFNRQTNAMLGRISSLEGLAEIADKYYDRVRSANTFAGMELKAEFTDENKTDVKVDTKVMFALDMPSTSNYRLSYALTQDNMGPYRQDNNYAGTNYQMGGWESLPSRVNVRHNHVGRDLFGFPGLDNSVKAGMKKGEISTDSRELSLANVTGSRVKVIAMLVSDGLTGEVMNAREVELRIRQDEPVPSAESGTFDESFYLTLTSADDATIYYTIDGSEPTTSSLLYTEPIPVDQKKMTIKAFAVGGGLPDSKVLTVEYRVRNAEPLAIDTIATDETSADAVWYNLQGVRVAAPEVGGVYVKVVGGNAEKVLVK